MAKPAACKDKTTIWRLHLPSGRLVAERETNVCDVERWLRYFAGDEGPLIVASRKPTKQQIREAKKRAGYSLMFD